VNDLDKLAVDLEREAIITPRDVRAVVGKGALNIKKEWRQRARGIEHAPRYPNSIGYDWIGPFMAEIGPEDSPDDQGFLGHILEFGGAHNSPRNDGGQALDAELPRFERAIQDLAGRHLT
jgi:hypothetical protein